MPILSDNARKALIIGPTAVLPRPLRVALRKRQLGKLEVAIAQRSQLIIIAHPKSGNTWLKVMLARLYQVRHGFKASELIGSDELALRNPAIPRLAAPATNQRADAAARRVVTTKSACGHTSSSALNQSATRRRSSLDCSSSKPSSRNR